MITIAKSHDFCAAHRIWGHEGDCGNLHGHNYTVHLEFSGELDTLGRVVDFTRIKKIICKEIDDMWDHKIILHHEDPLVDVLRDAEQLVAVMPYMPTAEKMARYVAAVVQDVINENRFFRGVALVSVTIDETPSSSAVFIVEDE